MTRAEFNQSIQRTVRGVLQKFERELAAKSELRERSTSSREMAFQNAQVCTDASIDQLSDAIYDAIETQAPIATDRQHPDPPSQPMIFTAGV